ncbi:MAG: hypothetical protein GC160_01270 [Acidobacteria bacterium]|nr:hypothetical protein [Acidobacteriota bacterium]
MRGLWGAWSVAALVWLAPAHALAGPYLGASACETCHPRQAKAQAASAHARALSRPADHRLSGVFGEARELRREPGYTFRVGLGDGRLRVEASDGERTRRLVADWAFGAGEQAVTFVGRLDEEWYLEHHFSYYSATGAYGPTPGHQMLRADDLGQAVGVQYRTFSPQTEIMTCFRCHTTGPLALGEGYSIEPSELGVRCEACHGPGQAHVEAVGKGSVEAARKAIDNPARLSPTELLATCGACHRPPASETAEIDYRDPWNVRHQPLYLARSACFLGGGLTCMSCHDPHASVDHDAKAYDGLCRGCHNQAEAPPSAVCASTEGAACSSCHMPKTQPQPELTFTNHWIGVFEPGSLVPRR